jgi:hypothetical protein
MIKLNLTWKAVYEDKTELNQFASNGIENKYKDINREKLVRFDMINTFTGKAIYSIYLRDGKSLIYRRRTLMTVGIPEPVIVYLVGWRETVMTLSGPKNFVTINYIHEDGSISLDGPRNNLELLDFEQ